MLCSSQHQVNSFLDEVRHRDPGGDHVVDVLDVIGGVPLELAVLRNEAVAIQVVKGLGMESFPLREDRIVRRADLQGRPGPIGCLEAG